MAKHRPSGHSGRRSSRSRDESSQKKFDGKPGGKPRRSSAGKSRGDAPSAGSEKFFGKEKKSYGKKKFFSSSNQYDRKSEGGQSSGRPFKKFDEDAGRKKPFKKEGSRNTEASNSLRRENRFEKRDSEFGESYGKKKNFSSTNQYRRKSEGGHSSGRPFKKFDEDSGRKKPFKKGGFRDTGASNSLRRESRFEKRDSQFGEPQGKGRKSFSERKSTESYKKAEGTRSRVQAEDQAPLQTERIRLNKFISNSGVCSRREADELIKMGVISVNGKTITELGYKVNPGDEVRHENKVLKAEKPVYVLMNKPKGFLTTTSDPQERNTVMHLIGNKIKERIYPVGRLDRNTTGLLLLTNDGDLADKLMHPSYNAKKIYKVELDRALTKADAQLILDGVQLEEGKAMVDDIAIISDDKKTVGIEIHIGWNRVVRRIFEALNYQVVKLDRSVYAGLDKKDLGRGEWRFLTKEELVRLKHFK